MENFSKQIIYVGSTWRYILAYVSEKFLARPISKVLLQKIIKKCSTRSLNNYPFIGWILLNVKTMPKILLYLTMSKLLLSNLRFFGIADAPTFRIIHSFVSFSNYSRIWRSSKDHTIILIFPLAAMFAIMHIPQLNWVIVFFFCPEKAHLMQALLKFTLDFIRSVH